ncbi:DoxX family protein [Serratia rubidaea]|uniref:DoxX family protein n=1 Tax=Serratia rubidaea TaxID=61652 RepID=A0ABS0MGC5_SERRU|nr:DoxX family protein [Serratia rubidaea]MBH1930723.1 DoxX family protein [Serratia rubidaea]MDC6116643.1 DoxX family protein [Serratia rubidaea]
MNTNLSPVYILMSRVFLALIFVLSGLAKLSAIDATKGHMEAMHVPGFLVFPTVIFEVGGGLLIMLGYRTRIIALLFAVFSLVTAFIFHNQFADPAQMNNFLKNISISGGFLLLASVGAGSLSLDARKVSSLT